MLQIFEDIGNIVGSYYGPRVPLFKKLFFGERAIDAILHMPSYVIERVYRDELSQSDFGKIVICKIKVDSIEINNRSSSPITIYGRVGGHQIIEITLFNYRKEYARSNYAIGREVCISGKLVRSIAGTFQFINPEKANKRDNGFFNIYPLVAGIAQKTLYSVMPNILKALENSKIDEWIPHDLMQDNGFVTFYESLKNIHFPKQFFEVQLESPYRRRIAFDELLSEQLVIRLSNPKTRNGHIIQNPKILIGKVRNLLNFELTNSQENAIGEIFHDLESGRPMSRLLQGDVGSGKTIVALMTVLYAIESGYQCAILAPTEILARQHFNNMKSLFEQLELSVELLTSNEKGLKRKDILERLENGKIDLLVGTHAIISEKVKYRNLALVVIDEQHRFGVNQRLQLIEKGVSMHVLSMTATPIPRTVVMSMYGDISVSVIREKPFGRKEIITKALPMDRIMEVVQSIRNIVSKGQKVYWICPLIEESEKMKYTCVINRFNFLRKHFGDMVEMLHGKMKNGEKQHIFERFKNGDCSILVSTTVIEVGVDVPEASVIFIENSEKFGLAQLHQLRGRVGRSDLQSYCILLFERKTSPIALKRINIMRETFDGFKIAQQDLYLRGGGEVLGTRQSGQKAYRTFDINDPANQPYIQSLIEQASHLASKIVESGQVTQERFQVLLKIFNKENVETKKLSF